MIGVTCRAPSLQAQLRPDPKQSQPAFRQIALNTCLGALAAAHLACSQPALAGKTFLDLPECDAFQQAGAIAYCGTWCPPYTCCSPPPPHADVKAGTGPPPEAGDLIVVDYTARELLNGTVYDGSRGFAFTIGNGEVCTVQPALVHAAAYTAHTHRSSLAGRQPYWAPTRCLL